MLRPDQRLLIRLVARVEHMDDSHHFGRLLGVDLEAMGEKLLPDALVGRLVLDPLLANGTVYPERTLPADVSGGLKSKGHPVGATGVSQHVMAAMQLTDTAGELQLENAGRAAVHNMGGLAIANYVSVLERRPR